MADDESIPALSVSGLSKSFGGVRALADASVVVGRGEVLGLLGENGSGKSTLIKVLAGFHEPDEGATIEVRGVPLRRPVSQEDLQRLGLCFVHQDLGLIPSVSVAENFLLVGFGAGVSRTRIRWTQLETSVGAMLEQYDVRVDPRALVQDLSPVERAMVAVVRAVSHGPGDSGVSLLVLDEPSVFLPAKEVGVLFDLIRRVAANGAGVLFVSHDISEVRSIADRITVLRDGRVVATVESQGTSEDEIVRLILGAELVKHAIDREVGERDESVAPLLRATRVRGRTVDDLSFDIAPGEVLGVTGLQGSGFEELPYLLLGASGDGAGAVSVGADELDLATVTPGQALLRGMVLIPGDRLEQSVVADLSVEENLSLPALQRFTRYGTVNWRKVRGRTDELVGRFDVRMSRPESPIGSLSGGNQQKVVLAKWLQLQPRVIVMHEPTQGVDVGARVSIVREIRNAAAAGAAVIVASSDYEALADSVDRVIVLARGRSVSELTGDDIEKSRINDVCLRSVSIGQQGARVVTEDTEPPGAWESAELVRSGEVSARELVAASLDRVDRLGGATCSIVEAARDRALAEADAVDAGTRGGALAGVPFTVKEMTDTEGLLTELGSAAYAGRRPTHDAEVVRRLRAAGAVLVAKTTSPELALRPTTESELRGATRNAWNPTFGSGGSSGGAAVSVATGMVPFALGADGGGSIRIPAACNGVLGLKPSRARVPGAPGSYEAWAGFSTDGPIARHTIDLAAVLETIAGPAMGDPYAVAAGPTEFVAAVRRGRDDPRSLRVAFLDEAPHGVDPLMAEQVRGVVDELDALGHRVEAGGPDLNGLYDPFLTIIRGNAGALRHTLDDEQLASLEGSTLSFVMRGLSMSAADYCHAVDLARSRSAGIISSWEDLDLLVTPVTTHLPRRIGEMPRVYELDARWAEYMDWQPFTYPFNVTGQPALSLPTGHDPDTGLPLAVQLVAGPGQEAVLLEVAAALEARRPWQRLAPTEPLGGGTP